MLSMKNVSYGYRNKNKVDILVLNNVSIDFKAGLFYSVYGASGSGKTTCLSLLGGLESPLKGTISLDGKDIKEIGYNNLRKNYVSYVFQDFHLFNYMSAIENVMLAIDITGKIKNNKLAKEKAVELLTSLGLDTQEMNRRVTKLSGGQQQRVAIARALSTDAKYILADEPTGNLDKDNTQNIIDIFKKLVKEQGKCVIAVTHSERLKEQCDICYSLED
ncbi:ABC transporter ATP-binding protein [Clostridium sp. Marseille-P299]|uniref:ABC transporter ATP-binding protein n=1 Tax=Clostridium sp. Marseille-P299 TaxID=1805477 RepID=UPI00082C1B69|nr:ABC transporter ATP-binding protein [Clostridium sp. Marseille-P299]